MNKIFREAGKRLARQTKTTAKPEFINALVDGYSEAAGSPGVPLHEFIELAAELAILSVHHTHEECVALAGRIGRVAGAKKRLDDKMRRVAQL